MPPIGNRGGDSDTSAVDVDPNAPVDPDLTVDPATDPAVPAVVDNAPAVADDVVAPEPVKDDRVRLQLVNTIGPGDSFVSGEYTISTEPTPVPPEAVDAIVASAAAEGLQVVNLDSQEG